MTYTTNTSTAESPATYANLAKECRLLADVARDMDAIATENPRFRDDPEFGQLRARLKTALLRIESLATAI
jgi:hypothetical protein